MASGADVNFFRLGGVFFLPLLLSPFIALALASMLYSMLHFLRLKFEITSKSFVIVEEEAQAIPNRAHSTAIALEANPKLRIGIQTGPGTGTGYSGAILGIGLQKLVDVAHFLSAGAVGFARGLNDTPKIVALLIGLQVLEIHWAMWIVAIAMAAGGLLNARKVAVTMSKKISSFNDGQGLTALLVTSFLVIFSSVLAFPVSTTHVSVGSIAGIGLANRTANKDKISSIGLSWILTLPIAAGISALAYAIISI
jgi:PiT family inorganic phosphate transporter